MTVYGSEDRVDWLLREICEANNFPDSDCLRAELSEVLSLPLNMMMDVLSECYMSYPTSTF